MKFIAKAFLVAVFLLWLVAGGVACGQPSAEAVPEEGPQVQKTIDQVLREHTDSLMALPGVVGTAQGLCDDKPCIQVFVVEATEELLKQIPEEIEGYTVDVQQTGELKALDPK